MCLSVWASNEPLCSNACASISFCALLSFCVFLLLYMSLNLCMFLSLYVFLSHCASPKLYSLNFYMPRHLCMWSNVCAWLCGYPWASLFLCLYVLIFVHPQVFKCPWTLVTQFKCIPESLYSCVWVFFSEPLYSSVCAHEFAHAILHWPFVSDSVHLWDFALYISDLVFFPLLHLISPAFHDVFVLLFLCVTMAVS